MSEIVRIIIRGTSGYGPVDCAFSDRVSITIDSIRYEYKPYMESENNRPIRWSYKTSNPLFRELFAEACQQVAGILSQDDEEFVLDIGSTTFAVTYADKSRRERVFYLPSDSFTKCFAVMKKMVPSLEAIPIVLITEDDY